MNRDQLRPSIGVVIPTFNRPDMVLEAVHSVLAQSRAPHRVVVVDDGSVAPQREELQALAASGAIRLIRQPNRGVNAACNRGAREVDTEYLLVLGDDDTLEPRALELLADVLDARPDAVGVGGGGRRRFEPGGALGPVELPRLERGDYLELTEGNPFFAGAVLFRRSAFLAVGGYEDRVPVIEDWDLWLRLSTLGPLLGVPVDVIRYRVHGNNMSRGSKVAALSVRMAEIHIEKQDAALREQLLPRFGAYLASTYFCDTLWHARTALRRGHIASGLRDGAVAWRIAALAVRSAPGRQALREGWAAHRAVGRNS